jgi:hypothetical protein
LITTARLARHGLKVELPRGESAHLCHGSYPEPRYEVLRDPFWGTFLESYQRANPAHFSHSLDQGSGKASKQSLLGLLGPLEGRPKSPFSDGF